MIFVGIDWAEAHHDVCVLGEDGNLLARGRLPDGVEGVARLHEMVAAHAEEPADVAVGIEIDRGLLVGALVAAGYRVYAVNPMAASRYRERHTASRAKSDPGDAKMLADRCAPTATTTARWHPTASCSPRSRSWPAPTRA